MTEELAAAVAALQAQVKRMEDVAAVARVVTRYGLAVDSGDTDATVALYTEDATLDLGADSQFHGSDGVRAPVTGPRHQAIVHRCARTMGPLDVGIDGDTAVATGYVRVYVEDPNRRCRAVAHELHPPRTRPHRLDLAHRPTNLACTRRRRRGIAAPRRAVTPRSRRPTCDGPPGAANVHP